LLQPNLTELWPLVDFFTIYHIYVVSWAIRVLVFGYILKSLWLFSNTQICSWNHPVLKTMSVKILAHRNNSLPLIGFEPMGSAILRLLVQCVNHSATLYCVLVSVFVYCITTKGTLWMLDTSGIDNLYTMYLALSF
jgi:hypothetical protein